MEKKINQFIVHYYKISKCNGLVFTEKSRNIGKALLNGCLYLELSVGSDENRSDQCSYNYEEMLKTLAKFAVHESKDNDDVYRLLRWFPSLVEEGSPFLGFAELMWMAWHYFSQEERKVFEEIILPVWVEGRREEDRDIAMHKTLIDMIKDRFLKNGALPDDAAKRQMLEYFSELTEKYLKNLYTGENVYENKRRMVRIWKESFEECILNVLKEAG